MEVVPFIISPNNSFAEILLPVSLMDALWIGGVGSPETSASIRVHNVVLPNRVEIATLSIGSLFATKPWTKKDGAT